MHNSWSIVILFCLTLGLAPFFPEPHIWGKLKWIAGGAHGMQLIDWFDTLMHGFPFILLLRLGIIEGSKVFRKPKARDPEPLQDESDQ